MQVFGHRGSPGFPRFAENTAASFRKALSEGAAGFELDVRRCADGTIVVVHDATIDRTTDGSGPVRDLTYSQIAGFNAGCGEPIPRLTDILDEFGGRCTIHIELKAARLAEDVATMVLDRHLPATVVLSAFDADDNDDENTNPSWTDLGSVASTLPIALLVTDRKLAKIGSQRLIEAAAQYGARGLHVPRRKISSDVATLARNANLALRVWTVNDPDEALRLRDFGVEAIFSDCPERCIRALAG